MDSTHCLLGTPTRGPTDPALRRFWVWRGLVGGNQPLAGGEQGLTRLHPVGSPSLFPWPSGLLPSLTRGHQDSRPVSLWQCWFGQEASAVRKRKWGSEDREAVVRFWRSESEHTMAPFVQLKGRPMSQQTHGCVRHLVKASFDCGCSVGSERPPRSAQQSLSGIPGPPVILSLLWYGVYCPGPRGPLMEKLHSAASRVHNLWLVQSLMPCSRPPSVCVWGGCCSFFSLGNKPAKGSEPSRFVFACEGTGESWGCYSPEASSLEQSPELSGLFQWSGS